MSDNAKSALWTVGIISLLGILWAWLGIVLPLLLFPAFIVYALWLFIRDIVQGRLKP